MAANFTPYDDVNVVLQELRDGARRILGDRYVGLYLYGSLATGDFDPGRSDIDFVVVTDQQLSPGTVAGLEKMHRRFASSDDFWARKLEGLYVPLGELRRYNPNGPELPSVNERQFYLSRQGSDWVLQRYTLREQEAVVDGPSLRPFIDPVSLQEMRGAVRQLLQDWWAPMLDDPSWIKEAEYQVFAVQTMCRVLFTWRTGQAVSKSEATAWAMAKLDEGWRDLIAEAAAWRRGRSFDRLDEVLALMQVVVGQVLPQS